MFNLLEEEILEPIARSVRFKKGYKALLVLNGHKKTIDTLVDLGCGPKMRFLKFLQKNGVTVKNYIGIDPLLDDKLVNKYSKHPSISLIKSPVDKKIPLNNGSADVVVGFAFLEHIDNPDFITNESVRLLKKGGRAIFTTPSYAAKPILEFLSFKLHIISPREIEEHKNYFTKEDLHALVTDASHKHVKIEHEYFEFGWNNLFVLVKK